MNLNPILPLQFHECCHIVIVYSDTGTDQSRCWRGNNGAGRKRKLCPHFSSNLAIPTISQEANVCNLCTKMSVVCRNSSLENQITESSWGTAGQSDTTLVCPFNKKYWLAQLCMKIWCFLSHMDDAVIDGAACCSVIFHFSFEGDSRLLLTQTRAGVVCLAGRGWDVC